MAWEGVQCWILQKTIRCTGERQIPEGNQILLSRESRELTDSWGAQTSECSCPLAPRPPPHTHTVVVRIFTKIPFITDLLSGFHVLRDSFN